MKVKNVFWDVSPCEPCKTLHIRGTYRLHLQGRKIRERIYVYKHTANVFLLSQMLFAREFLCPEDGGDTFSETSVFTTPTRRHITEDCIFVVTAVKTSNLT
jgi:hypothetical protein